MKPKKVENDHLHGNVPSSGQHITAGNSNLSDCQVQSDKTFASFPGQKLNFLLRSNVKTVQSSQGVF